LFPDHEKVTLVPIPYGEKQQASQQFISRLLHLADEQLDDLWDSDPKEAEDLESLRPIYQNSTMGRIIPLSSIKITKDAAKKYHKLRAQNAERARGFATCFKQMRYVTRLISGTHDTFHYKGKDRSLEFHFYKRIRTVERPFFFTEPQDVCVHPTGKVENLVIAELEIEVNGNYKQGPEILKSLKFPLETVSFEKEFPQDDIGEESILLVPLGTSPMIATQLYTLLTDQNHIIHKVVLIYPTHRLVLESARLVEDALQGKGVECQKVILSGYNDIDSTQACMAYQALVEQTIDDINMRYAQCRLEIAISGGRKGMAALTMFAAQRKGIRHVYHTLITDEHIDKTVSEQTTIDELKKISKTDKQTCNDRLFLDAYANDRAKFVVFKVPIVPVLKG
jgi:CRISPR-associated Csx14 family protein